ncbi:Prp18 domain-containing protein [Aphelenchoides avenae]|nr:Prp18 domain-containing protein [Aphelenchus avenae]
MDFLKAVVAQKRKQIDEVAIEINGTKLIKNADLYQKENYLKKKEQAQRELEKGSEEKKAKLDVPESTMDLPRADVIRRLRARGHPIILFGESDKDSLARLRKLEIEQPELKEGWKNDFQTALNKVDEELVEEVIKGSHNQVGKHDVKHVPESDSWDKIFDRASLLGQDEDANRDCDIIREFLNYILSRWGRDLNARDEAVKRTPKGKLETAMLKQTMEHMKPLMMSLEKYNVNFDIRHHLITICRLCILDRDYIRANNAYMEMAIGNAPWPVGVTRSGIHQRPGSAKAYVSNIAHVLNDETQRKYIHAVKRIMSKCQDFFPTDPSRCVEYVKKADPAAS